MEKKKQLFVPGLEPEKKELDEIYRKYNLNIKAPIYEPKQKKPFVVELCDLRKTNELIEKINRSNVAEDEKKFLIEAARRHSVFNFRLIADYYAHASKEMQELMEDSALVIIDFEKAIEKGFAKLTDDLVDQFLEDEDDG